MQVSPHGLPTEQYLQHARVLVAAGTIARGVLGCVSTYQKMYPTHPSTTTKPRLQPTPGRPAAAPKITRATAMMMGQSPIS
jgi:hypothetical protein